MIASRRYFAEPERLQIALLIFEHLLTLVMTQFMVGLYSDENVHLLNFSHCGLTVRCEIESKISSSFQRAYDVFRIAVHAVSVPVCLRVENYLNSIGGSFSTLVAWLTLIVGGDLRHR